LVGQNSGSIFLRLWTKVHQIRYTCAEVIVVCNAVFRSSISCGGASYSSGPTSGPIMHATCRKPKKLNQNLHWYFQ